VRLFFIKTRSGQSYVAQTDPEKNRIIDRLAAYHPLVMEFDMAAFDNIGRLHTLLAPEDAKFVADYYHHLINRERHDHYDRY
jgi:hypothetical protein